MNSRQVSSSNFDTGFVLNGVCQRWEKIKYAMLIEFMPLNPKQKGENF